MKLDIPRLSWIRYRYKGKWEYASYRGTDDFPGLHSTVNEEDIPVGNIVYNVIWKKDIPYLRGNILKE